MGYWSRISSAIALNQNVYTQSTVERRLTAVNQLIKSLQVMHSERERSKE